jgi:hypothetical protein
VFGVMSGSVVFCATWSRASAGTRIALRNDMHQLRWFPIVLVALCSGCFRAASVQVSEVRELSVDQGIGLALGFPLTRSLGDFHRAPAGAKAPTEHEP